MPYLFDKTPRRFLGGGKLFQKSIFKKLLILKLDTQCESFVNTVGLG